MRGGDQRVKERHFGGDRGLDCGDLNGLETKVAYLRKRSSRGFWQRRHVRLQNRWLLYAKSKSAAAPDVSVDLRNVAAARVADRFGEFALDFAGGKSLRLRARSAKEATDWVECVKARVAYFERLARTARQVAAERIDDRPDPCDSDDEPDDGAAVVREGFLLKLSDRAVVGFQKRWVALRPRRGPSRRSAAGSRSGATACPSSSGATSPWKSTATGRRSSGGSTSRAR